MSDEMIPVRVAAVEWLKTHYPSLCVKAGLCESVAGRLYTRTSLTTPVKAAEVPLSNDEALDQIQHVFEHDEWREQAWEHGILMETNDNELAARVKAHANRYVAELIAAAPAQGKAVE